MFKLRGGCCGRLSVVADWVTVGDDVESWDDGCCCGWVAGFSTSVLKRFELEPVPLIVASALLMSS